MSISLLLSKGSTSHLSHISHIFWHNTTKLNTFHTSPYKISILYPLYLHTHIIYVPPPRIKTSSSNSLSFFYTNFLSISSTFFYTSLWSSPYKNTCVKPVSRFSPPKCDFWLLIFLWVYRVYFWNFNMLFFTIGSCFVSI